MKHVRSNIYTVSARCDVLCSLHIDHTLSSCAMVGTFFSRAHRSCAMTVGRSNRLHSRSCVTGENVTYFSLAEPWCCGGPAQAVRHLCTASFKVAKKRAWTYCK